MPTYSWPLTVPAPPTPVAGIIAFIDVVPRSRRRLWLKFSEPLGAAAFTTLTFYTIVAETGTAPSVVAAFVVPSNTSIVELALDADLVEGLNYLAYAEAVPDSDGDVTPAGSVLPFRIGVQRPRPVAASLNEDALDATFGVDLVWDGSDIVEDAQGDLATVGGRENARAAIARRLTSDGLPWDDSYGGKPREYVDGSPFTAHQLRGTLAAQAVEDDRVKRAAATVLPADENNPEQTTIEVNVILIDGTAIPVQSGVRTQ